MQINIFILKTNRVAKYIAVEYDGFKIDIDIENELG